MTEQKEGPWWQPGLLLFTRLSGWIGGPIVMAVFLGRWLDKKYGTEPWLFLLSVGVAFVISMVGIVRDATREMKRIEKESVAIKDSADKFENKKKKEDVNAK